MSVDITSQLRSRYKDTAIFTDSANGDYYALMEVPFEFADYEEPANYRNYTVTQADVGFPDLIAVKTLGPNTEDLWWIIMLVNGIVDVENGLYPGLVLVIPPLASVTSFLSRT